MTVLCWISDMLLKGSSFGQVSLEITKRLRNFKVYVLGLDYFGTPISPFPGLDILPLKNIQQLNYYLRRLNPEVTVLFQSFYFLERLKNVRWPGRTILYIPVEGEKIPENYLNQLFLFDQVIVPSKYSQSILKKEGIKSKVVYHGVDSDFFSPKVKPILKEFRWGYLGQNDIRKQLPRIMEAYSRLPKKNRGNLVIASPNEGHYNLSFLAKTFKISPIFVEKKFVGIPLARFNLLQFYHSLSCYVNCATEAFGLPSLESAASGIPNIALDHGASREIMKGGALYVKVKDKLDTNIGQIGLADRDDLYRKMKIILEVPPERKRLVKEGLKRAKYFTWEKTVTKLEEILNE